MALKKPGKKWPIVSPPVWGFRLFWNALPDLWSLKAKQKMAWKADKLQNEFGVAGEEPIYFPVLSDFLA
jgi:hypothetical protein